MKLFEIFQQPKQSSMIVSYRKLIKIPSRQGYLDVTEVAKRYEQTSRDMTLTKLLTHSPAKDLKYFLIENKAFLYKLKGNLLDLGCGTGAYSLLFKARLSPIRTLKYEGTEINSIFVQICNKCFPHESFFVAKGEHIPRANNSYSLVIASGVLQYTLQRWRQTLKELARVDKAYLILSRLPLTKLNNSFYVEQLVNGPGGKEVHNYIILNRLEFEKSLSKIGWKIMARDVSSEYYVIPGLDETIFSYQYLLKRQNQ